MIDFIYWLLWWGFLLAVGGYFSFVAVAIALKTARLLFGFLIEETGLFISKASFNLGLWIVDVIRWGLMLAASRLRPWINRIRPADPEEKKRELAALSNSLKDARDILGLPEKFSRDDLNVAYRGAARRVAPESGGTEGLLRAVNWRGTC